MALFDQILGAVNNSTSVAGLNDLLNVVNNSTQAGSLDDLLNIATTVKQLGNSVGVDSSTIQSLLLVVAKEVQSSLQVKEATDGSQSVQDFVNQFAVNSPSSESVNTLFTPDIQAKVTENAAQITNLDVEKIQELLPSLVPLILSFLHKSGNPLLNKFLAIDGDVDIANLLKLATGFLGI
ncbi:MAG: hypothetical protein ACKO86_09005 [Dolichospermum sp.]